MTNPDDDRPTTPDDSTARHVKPEAAADSSLRLERIAQYRILELLGTGGMGSVFKAHDERLDRVVALKVLAPHLTHSPEVSRRFLQEAWIAGKLDHPNLAKVFDRGVEQGLTWYSMEYIQGRSIASVLQQMHESKSDPELGLDFGTKRYIDWVIQQLIDAAEGVAHAHAHHVVHRDVKPLNLMLDSEHKTIKLIDFGLALATDFTRHTEQGAVFGTVAYMAPEQLKGANDAIGPWTDVYALGVTLFELLTLSLPYAGVTPQAYAHSVLNEEARSVTTLVRGVSGDLQIVLKKAMEKDPRDRYQDAGAFALDLENVLAYRPINARAVSRLGRLSRWVKRKPMHAALAATLLVATPAIGVLGWRAMQHAALVRQAARAADMRELTWLMTQSARQLEAHEKANALLADDPGNIEALRLRAIAAAHLAEREKGPAQQQRLAALYADIDLLQAKVPFETWPVRLRNAAREQFEPGFVAPTIATPEKVHSPVDLFYEALLVAEHDKQRAVELMSELIAQSPRGQQLTLVRAYWYSELKRYDDAQVDYRVAAALDPENPYAALGLARVFTLTQRFDDAEREYRRALELEPNSGPALQGLADNALAQGRAAATPELAKPIFARALAYARRALAADPNLPWAHLNIGASLIEGARLDPSAGLAPIEEAIEHYRAARDLLAKNPRADQEGESAGVIQNLCDAELQARRLDAALVTCRQAVEAAPNSATAHYNLAGAYALSGDFERALDELEKNVALGDRDVDYLDRDEWFAPLRKSARFRQLLSRMRSLL